MKHTSIHSLLVMVSLFDLVEKRDVKSTFLHGELEEIIYMDHPEGFIVERNKDQV